MFVLLFRLQERSKRQSDNLHMLLVIRFSCNFTPSRLHSFIRFAFLFSTDVVLTMECSGNTLPPKLQIEKQRHSTNDFAITL